MTGVKSVYQSTNRIGAVLAPQDSVKTGAKPPCQSHKFTKAAKAIAVAVRVRSSSLTRRERTSFAALFLFVLTPAR